MRDNRQCQIRGPQCLGIADSVDHILARSRGGSDALGNLVAACGTCNKSKGDSLVGPVVTINW